MHTSLICRSMLLLLVVSLTAFAGPPDTRPTTRPEVIDAVQRLISDPGSAKYRKAVADPGIKTDAWPLLERAVREPVASQSGPIHLRSDSTDLLEAMAAIDAPRSVELVLEMAHASADARMRYTAVNLISYDLKLDTAESRAVIRGCLDDPNGLVVDAALTALTRQPDPQAGPRVCDIMRHPPVKPMSLVQENSGMVSGNRGELFNDAVWAIGAMKFTAAVDDLTGLTRDPSADLRSLAVKSLGQCIIALSGPARTAGMDRLVALLDDCNAGVRSTTADVLADVGDRRALPALAHEMRAQTTFDASNPPGRINVFDTVRRLEKLTGADYGSESAWNFSVSETDKAHLIAFAKRAQDVLADLKKRGVNPDEFPHLPRTLTAADQAMFDGWFAKWLVDPRGGTLVMFDYPARTCWGGVTTGRCGGWLFPASAGHPACLLLADGDEVPVPDKFEKVDLPGEAQKRIHKAIHPSLEPEFDSAVFDKMEAGSHGRPGIDADCIRAAWLYRLGDSETAAQLLFLSRGNGDLADSDLQELLSDNAWSAFSEAVNAWIARDDDTAWARLDKLRRLYPDRMDKFGCSHRLISELERHRAEGTFVAHAPPATMPAEDARMSGRTELPKLKTPDGFDQWQVDRRVAWLIGDLQEMDQRQQSQPGGVDDSDDPRVQALIAIGDPAVPALIDCIDHDERLTRSVQFWRDFSRDRNIIGVRECALSAVESILGTSVFEPASTGDSFSGRGENQAHKTAKQLRAYWEKYGKIPFTRRMMGILIDPKSTTSAAYSAAYALAHANEERRIGTQIWTGGAKPKPGSNPVIGEFDKPTVAEAILALYDRRLAELDHPEKGTEPASDYERKRVKDDFADLLMTLQDRRITPALMPRCGDAKSPDDLRRWATVCYVLAEERPMFTLAAKFGSGQLELGPVDPQSDRPMNQPGNVELTEWVKCLGDLDNAFADNAINLLADPRHPYHARAAAIVRTLMMGEHTDSDTVEVWSAQPVYVRLARPLLDDVTPTDTTVSIVDDRLRRTSTNGWSSRGVPVELSDPQTRRASARLRVCDVAAAAICDDVAGCPDANALYKDSEDRLMRMKQFLDAQGSGLRRMPGRWRSRADFGSVFDGPAMCPAVGLTGSPDRPLPLVATWTPPGAKPQKVLIVSVVKELDGRETDLILARHDFKNVAASELTDIKGLE